MNKKIRNTFRICLIIVFMVIVCWKSGDIVIRKDSRNRFSDFYALKNKKIDVLFLGSSHTYHSINPLVLWKDFGITAYNMATTVGRVPAGYWILKNALRYTQPDAVVLEVAYLDENKISGDFSHDVFDSIPLSRFKYEAAIDVFDNDSKAVLEAMVPFSRFHNRWKELKNEDFTTKTTHLMGFYPSYKVKVSKLPAQLSEKPKAIDTVGVEYVYKIIQLCKEMGIKLIFYSYPFLVNEASQNDLAIAAQIAEENEIEFITPDDVLNTINLYSDFNDHAPNTSHANFSGALKTTRMFGSVLQTQYGLPGHKNETEFSEWDEYYSAYYETKKTEFQEIKDLSSYLIKSYDDDFLYFVEINHPEITESDFYRHLLENIGVDFSDYNNDSSALFLINDHQTVFIQQDYLNHPDTVLDSPLGNVVILEPDEDRYEVLLDNQVIYSALYSDLYHAGIRISVFEKETLKQVDNVFWKISKADPRDDISPMNGISSEQGKRR